REGASSGGRESHVSRDVPGSTSTRRRSDTSVGSGGPRTDGTMVSRCPPRSHHGTGPTRTVGGAPSVCVMLSVDRRPLPLAPTACVDGFVTPRWLRSEEQGAGGGTR